MLEMSILPARQGDAIWIRWGDSDAPHQIFIDMGTESTGNRIHSLLSELRESQRIFELLVITHVDSDHIGGVLTALTESPQIPGLRFNEVWFNGWAHLNDGQIGFDDENSELESFGPAQGARLSSWLRSQPWNRKFDGRAVKWNPEVSKNKIDFPRGLTLTVLGPTKERLNGFIKLWKEEVELALKKGTLDDVDISLEGYGNTNAPELKTLADLSVLADSAEGKDTSPANGTSISLLLEYKDRRIVLAGDAFSVDLFTGLKSIFPDKKILLDAFKIPHHGSKNNLNKKLIELVDCPAWIFSTDGSRFRHPDVECVARILKYSTHRPSKLFFNVPSKFNEWWNNVEWKEKFSYITEYGDPEDGITIAF